MSSVILVISLIGMHGHAITTIEFPNLQKCEAAFASYKNEFESQNAPGWFAGKTGKTGGIIVKGVCTVK